jgi:outer membrane protein TolC
MPLINRGATKAQVEAARARAEQAVAGYRSTVLQAFAEVENALDQDHYQARQEAFLEDSVQQARRAVALAESRYGRGLDNILVALESQRRLYTAESNLLTTQRLRRAARVNLIQALGGPWDASATLTFANTQQGADQ